MKYIFLSIVLLFLTCSSEEKRDNSLLSDTSYEVKFSPCTCRREEMIVHAKKAIVIEGIKDYEQIKSKDIEPDLETEILEKDYEQFLYDFSLDSKPKEDLETGKEIINATGKVRQNELDLYVKKNSSPNPPKNYNTKSGEYHSKGLEVIKGFKSDRRKRQTVEEASKSRPIILYEINRK